ncbi:MAG: hypothetical protein ACF8Q5_12655 [Phycisphaerales bacterium JB040]
MSDAHTQFDPNADELFVDPPGWPKVIGILSIVFGSISVFCGGIGAAFLPFQAGMIEGQLNGAPPPPSVEPNAITLGLLAASIAINILLVVAGSMLVLRKPAARMAHLLYVLLFLPVVIFGSINTLNVQKATEEWAQQYPDNPIAQSTLQQMDMGVNMGLIGAVANLLIGLAWPLFCVIWFGFVKTRPHHMTGEAPPDDPFAPAS